MKCENVYFNFKEYPYVTRIIENQINDSVKKKIFFNRTDVYNKSIVSVSVLYEHFSYDISVRRTMSLFFY